ncbi:hypothetical protein QTP88_029546 [Uroleucon formosanum]
MNESDETKGFKRNGSISILSYFYEKPRNDECVELDNNSCSTISNKLAIEVTDPYKTILDNNTVTDFSSVSQQSEVDMHVPKSTNMNAYDIGLCIDKQLTNEEKFVYLKNTWTPAVGYAFPIYKYGNQNRQFQLDWLRRFQWLSYSQLKNGGFCKFCILFAPNNLCTGSKNIELLSSHGNNKYHLLSAEKLKLIKKRLVPLIKTIIFCGQNNLSLRGHRDDGEFHYESAVTGDQGIFRSLLAFRLDSGDEILHEHLKNCNKNATLIKLNNSKYFAILCDETTDISTKEQITFSEFLGFTELLSTTGLTIKDVILKQIDAFGLSMTNLRGQGYDGGSNKSDMLLLVQTLILNEQPLALFTHCFNHVLNLAISKACNTPAIRNMFGIVGTVSVFLSASAKRNNILLNAISNDNNEPLPKKTKLRALCATRWVDRHDSIITFHELYKFILISLEELEKDTNRKVSVKASSFNSSVKQSEFVVALETVANLFDLSSAIKNVKNILNVFEYIRKNPDRIFITLFESAAQKLQIFDEELKVLRLSGHQTKRNNINANINQNPMDWFKITIFIPFLDHIIQELKSRFSDKFVKVIPLEGLIPIHKDSYSTEAILNAAMFYEQDLLSSSDLVLKAEINLWKTKWNKIETNIPHTAVTSLPYCEEYFPNIKILLQLFATLPVSTATAKRSFSTLRRLKNYMRSTMTESRLNGLALLNIHKEKQIDIDLVVDQFTRKKKEECN